MASTPNIPAQSQEAINGSEAAMNPQPQYDRENYRGSGKLKGKVALITGGDSGIGRSIAVLYAKEGADVAISYLHEDEDAQKTKHLVEEQGRKCLSIPGDIGNEPFCQKMIETVIQEFGHLDILVNNAAEQQEEEGTTLENVTPESLHHIFSTNLFSMFYLIKAAIPHFKEGSTIINTTSVTAYEGNGFLISYSSTKGAIVALTRSLAAPLLQKGIRINAVAPGPIWTPMIPATASPEEIERFGKNVMMQRPGQPVEVATSYVFLASEDSSYFTGQVLHPNGGTVING
ncbi:SDR family oxidoreductase [Oscillatoria sp. FACHB-1406]|uniref:SDR family oxidoreductase n=1 Tax=Oscillatoria sp. FACHB-1406 TaxID=2692846 RepID=UPI00168918AF|nr:SDR family oxidoreductase [Oscillatoria sp. FACHB-1406]MBD2578744.1 SDR family oxidoreductase [Oscillatoria sp. FACHB-1406]